MTNREVQTEQSKIFEKYGAFFAFSTEQFEEQYNPEIKKYVRFGCGLLCPKVNAEAMEKELDALQAKKKENAKSMSEADKKKLIMHELANHECQFTDYTNALPALESHGITEEEVKKYWAEYYNYCVENDMF